VHKSLETDRKTKCEGNSICKAYMNSAVGV
jgi:hypothetical protein